MRLPREAYRQKKAGVSRMTPAKAVATVYDIYSFNKGTIVPTVNMFRFNVVREFTLLENCAGSLASCRIAPDDRDAVILIKVDDDQIGTIRFARGYRNGVFESIKTNVRVGSALTLTMSVVDTKFADVAVTFACLRGA